MVHESDSYELSQPISNDAFRAKHDIHETKQPAAVTSKRSQTPTTPESKAFDLRLIEHHNFKKSHAIWFSEQCLGPDKHIGLSTHQIFGKIKSVVLATSKCAAILRMPKKKTAMNPFLKSILSSNDLTKFGHKIWRDAALIYANFDVKTSKAVDVETAIDGYMWTTKMPKQNRFSVTEAYEEAIEQSTYDEGERYYEKIRDTLSSKQDRLTFWNAWKSFVIGCSLDVTAWKADAIIDMELVNPSVLKVHAKYLQASLSLEEPFQEYESSYASISSPVNGYDPLNVVNDQYSNMLNNGDSFELRFPGGTIGKGSVLKPSHGKRATLKPSVPWPHINVEYMNPDRQPTLVVTESNAPDSEEHFRSLYASGVFRRAILPETNPLYDRIFDGTSILRTDKASSIDSNPVLRSRTLDGLNASQKRAVQTSISLPVALIQGPPGTGKTATISAITVESEGDFILCAQTNAAVRNMADALVKRQIRDFAVIVADRFYVEWHAATYQRDITIIKSSELQSHLRLKESDVRIFLLTFSQLSNPLVTQLLRPKKRIQLIIDEASQLFVGSILHVLQIHKENFASITFVGDPRQLAPYRSDEVDKFDIDSIFDLRSTDVMLDVTYRLPAEITTFISHQMYDDRLTPHKCESAVAKFINLCVDGQEEFVNGGWQNIMEARAVAALIQNEYHNKDFLVATPYQKQKDLIIRFLRDKNLSDRVRTVDSIQGQEAEFVIISTVRTNGLGFMKNEKRMNVALTRSKAQMILVHSGSLFMTKAGRNTLPGRLLAYFFNRAPALSYRDVISGMKTIDRPWVLKSSPSIAMSIKAKQPKQQKKHQASPISNVVHDFTPLISILESHRKAGELRVPRSVIGEELKAKLFKTTPVVRSKFGAYVEAAQSDGLVVLGKSKGGGRWISLSR